MAIHAVAVKRVLELLPPAPLPTGRPSEFARIPGSGDGGDGGGDGYENGSSVRTDGGDREEGFGEGGDDVPGVGVDRDKRVAAGGAGADGDAGWGLCESLRPRYTTGNCKL